MLDRLREVLHRREDGVLIATGFSFGDQHINDVVFEALSQNPRLHAFALCFADPAEDSDLFAASLKYTNLMLLAPTHCIVGGFKYAWSTPTLDEARASLDFMEWPADYETNFIPTSGKLKLGDFNTLSILIDSISSPE